MEQIDPSLIQGGLTPKPVQHGRLAACFFYGFGSRSRATSSRADEASLSWLTPQEVADRFAISIATIYRALREDRMPGDKILGCWRTDPAELDAWVRSQRRVPVPRGSAKTDFMDDVRALRDAAIKER